MTRTVLITGVSSGIGKATAKLFSEKGWKVIGLSRQKVDSMEFVDLYLNVDVSNCSDVEKAFDYLLLHNEQLDAVINNAALQICKPVTQLSIQEWDKTMETNLRSVFLFSKYSHPFLKKTNGSIINISSVHAVATSSDISAYAASKGGVSAFTRALAIEYGPDNIRVNAVLPGAVDTPMLRAGLCRDHVADGSIEEKLQELSNRHILGNICQPADIANMIYFLGDNSLSPSTTGQCFIIDGGATIRLSTE